MIWWGREGGLASVLYPSPPPLPPPREKKRIREVGGKQQLDLPLLPLKSVKVCGAAVLHHQHKALRHRRQ